MWTKLLKAVRLWLSPAWESNKPVSGKSPKRRPRPGRDSRTRQGQARPRGSDKQGGHDTVGQVRPPARQEVVSVRPAGRDAEPQGRPNQPRRDGGSSLEILRRPSPHHSSRRNRHVECSIIHYDAGPTATSTVRWLQDDRSKVSYHIVIARDGTVYRCVDLTRAAWHAGVARSPWGRDVNRHSLGICLSNRGDGEEFPEAQLVALEDVREWLRGLGYVDAANRLLGHDQVAPGRKIDPGPLFPRERFSFLEYLAAELK